MNLHITCYELARARRLVQDFQSHLTLEVSFRSKAGAADEERVRIAP